MGHIRRSSGLLQPIRASSEHGCMSGLAQRGYARALLSTVRMSSAIFHGNCFATGWRTSLLDCWKTNSRVRNRQAGYAIKEPTESKMVLVKVTNLIKRRVICYSLDPVWPGSKADQCASEKRDPPIPAIVRLFQTWSERRGFGYLHRIPRGIEVALS